jgi:hypothetical protein
MDVMRDINSLRSVAKKLPELEAEFQRLVALVRKGMAKEAKEPVVRDIFKAIGRCGKCTYDVVVEVHAVIDRNGVTEIVRLTAAKCRCQRPDHDDLDYRGLHSDHR